LKAGPRFVLDASALLAYLRGERGADTVRNLLVEGAAISAANWAEVLSKLADSGEDPDRAAQAMVDSGLVGATLLILPLDEALAVQIARLRMLTRSFGLSLGDRACLSLGIQMHLPVVTTDGAWKKIKLPIEVHTVR
jgi:ribonuclease VapC